MNNLKLLTDKELVEITGGMSDAGSWLMKRLADVYQFFCCNHNNGYYFDSHPEHNHDY